MHIHGKGTKLADHLAGSGVAHCGEILHGKWRSRNRKAKYVRTWCGGGMKDGVSGVGVVLEAASDIDQSGLPKFELVGGVGLRFQDSGGDSLVAKVCDMGFALVLVLEFTATGSIQSTPKFRVVCTSDLTRSRAKIIDLLAASSSSGGNVHRSSCPCAFVCC